jgi:TrpR family trp operon transcriptional repressor
MKATDQLLQAFLEANDKQALQQFLLGLFTPQELEQLNQRIEIVSMLKKGVPQRNIAQQLGVGIATVTRGAREIKMGRFKDVV